MPTGLSGTTVLKDNHNCTINFSPTINYHGASSSWTSPPGLPQQPKYSGTDGEDEEELKRLGRQQLLREARAKDPSLLAERAENRETALRNTLQHTGLQLEDHLLARLLHNFHRICEQFDHDDFGIGHHGHPGSAAEIAGGTETRHTGKSTSATPTSSATTTTQAAASHTIPNPWYEWRLASARTASITPVTGKLDHLLAAVPVQSTGG